MKLSSCFVAILFFFHFSFLSCLSPADISWSYLKAYDLTDHFDQQEDFQIKWMEAVVENEWVKELIVGAAVGGGVVLDRILGNKKTPTLLAEPQHMQKQNDKQKQPLPSQLPPNEPQKSGPEKPPSREEQKTNQELIKSQRSLEKKIKEHESKLEEYQKNPDAHDNKNFLKSAPPERREKIIKERVDGLNKEIKKFNNNINEITNIINQRGSK